MAGVFLLPLHAQAPPTTKLDIAVTDSTGAVIADALIEVSTGSRAVRLAQTNQLGRVLFADVKPGKYDIRATKSGMQPIELLGYELKDPLVRLPLTMSPRLTRTDSVEVRGTVMEVEEATSAPNKLPPQKAKELPNRPATVADALPLTPGVVREPGGGLILSASPEHRSALIVNSADVTDPATGQFGLTVPIDSVEVINVYQTAFLAEYGRFTAGLVSVETKRGGDKWKWEINDPLPEFRIRSYHLRGLKTATPRLNFEGPIVANKLFVSEGFEYEIRRTAVFTLPFPNNQKEQQGINSFTQLDWVASASHLLTATLHAAPQRHRGLNLDYFNPLPTSANARSNNITGTVTDRLSLWRGLLETRFSITDFVGDVWGIGNQPLRIGPAGNTGNFFADQNRTASRISGNAAYSFAPVGFGGTHQFKLGGYLASSEHTGSRVARDIEIVDMSGRRLQRVAFSRNRSFEISDIEKSFFAQDHWIVTPRLALDWGVRTESQQISGAFRMAPRTGVAWTPSNATHTVLRGGFGYFYDRVPLNVYGFNRYPDRFITSYDAAGNQVGPTVRYLNTLGQNRVRFPFVAQQPIDGNFSPRGRVWSAQVEQPVNRWLRLRATYIHNDSDGLVIMARIPPDVTSNLGAFLLEGTGESRYRQFDVVAQIRLREDRQLFLSYARSTANGDINDFGSFLGTVPTPVIRDNSVGTLRTDLPNRFIGWGVFRLPRKFQVAPVMEYRSGFPYSRLDVLQQYVGTPYSARFPSFFSLDSRFSKDIKVHPKYSVRISLSAFNLTNHFNPEAVHLNTADPAFGMFFGHRGRRFTADFDFLF